MTITASRNSAATHSMGARGFNHIRGTMDLSVGYGIDGSLTQGDSAPVRATV